MPIQTRDQLTPREYAIHNHDKEMLELQMAHAKQMKELEVESNRINSKWTTIFRLPLALIILPVKLVIVSVLVVYAIRGIEPPESITSFLRV